MKNEITIKLFGIGFSLYDRASNKDEYKRLFNNFNQYFKRRGFIVGKDPDYQEEYKILSKYHKFGKKNDLEFKAEYHSTGLKFEFYYEGCYNNNEYEKMPYMVKLSYRNEMLRFAKYLDKVGLKYNLIYPMTDEEKILDCEKSNPHIHGKDIKTLEDINRVVNNSDKPYNTTDANGKKIISGSVKYFYDSDTKRLSKGIAIHNINNMWWVLTNGVRRNIASSKLFDYSSELPKRLQLNKIKQVNKLRKVLQKEEELFNYERCILIRDEIKKIEGTQKKFRVWSIKWGSWWGPNNSGYTSNIRKAGVYLEETVMAHLSYYDDGEVNKLVEITN
jgi:hypothetical protein